MQLISRNNKETRFLSRVIDIFSKYAWVVPLKEEKGVTIAKGTLIQFQKSANIFVFI